MRLKNNRVHATFSYHAVIVLLVCSLCPTYHLYAYDKNSMLSEAATFAQKKQCGKALEIYEAILTRDPTIVSVYSAVVKCYNELGDSQGAFIFMETLFLDYPNHAEVNYGLGYALFNNQKYEKAAHYFDRAIELKPDLSEAWNNRAAIYQFIEKDAGKARQHYERAIDLAEKTNNHRVLKIAQENLSHLPQEKVVIPVSEVLTLEQFLNRFVRAVDLQDDKAIRELVMGQKQNCERAMDWLLDETLKASVQGVQDENNAALLMAQTT